jgi:hypothetical protein
MILKMGYTKAIQILETVTKLVGMTLQMAHKLGKVNMLEMNLMITMALKFVGMTLNMMVKLMEHMKVMILKQFAKINFKKLEYMRHFMDLNLLVNKILIQMNHLLEQKNLIHFELKVNSKPIPKMSFLMVLMKLEKLSYSIVQQNRENHQRFIKIHYFLEMSFPLFLSLMLF